MKHPEVAVHRIGAGVVGIRVAGELDLATLAEFESTVARALQRCEGPMVIDLTGCRFIDSAVLSLLIDVRTHLGNGDSEPPRFAVVAAAQPLRALRLTGLDRWIPVFTSMQDALHSLPTRGGTNREPSGEGSAERTTPTTPL